MSNGVTYKIVEYGDGYAFVEHKDLHATSTCVPLIIEQETKSGIDAACLAGGELQALRKRAARIRLEELITVSVAELRKKNNINRVSKADA